MSTAANPRSPYAYRVPLASNRAVEALAAGRASCRIGTTPLNLRRIRFRAACEVLLAHAERAAGVAGGDRDVAALRRRGVRRPRDGLSARHAWTGEASLWNPAIVPAAAE